jgi:selenophosphate synthetase-related protein
MNVQIEIDDKTLIKIKGLSSRLEIDDQAVIRTAIDALLYVVNDIQKKGGDPKDAINNIPALAIEVSKKVRGLLDKIKTGGQ